MLKLSTKARYALRAMIELSLHDGSQPLQLHEVASAQRISVKYLEQLTIPLRQSGLLQAERGPNGGYRLTRSAEEITAREIVEAVEGEVNILDCLGSTSVCDRAAVCAARGLWGRLNQAITSVLSETTLADLRNEQLLASLDEVACYHI